MRRRSLDGYKEEEMPRAGGSGDAPSLRAAGVLGAFLALVIIAPAAGRDYPIPDPASGGLGAREGGEHHTSTPGQFYAIEPQSLNLRDILFDALLKWQGGKLGGLSRNYDS